MTRRNAVELRRTWKAAGSPACEHAVAPLERTEDGYLTGYLVCSRCGAPFQLLGSPCASPVPVDPEFVSDLDHGDSAAVSPVAAERRRRSGSARSSATRRDAGHAMTDR